jgi:hypothetical protein
MERPKHISERFWLELIIGSRVAPDIAALNARYLEGDQALEAFIYALPNSARRNDGRIRDTHLNFYRHVTKGIDLMQGLDPALNWEAAMEWCRGKPLFPRKDWDKEKNQYKDKVVKYESPRGTANRVSYFRVSLRVWQLVAKRYNVPMPSQVVQTLEGEALGFWNWVKENPSVKIILTEGEKKALCLLSLGFVAIALPGIWGGRVGDKKSQEQLHPDLKYIAQDHRTIIVLFDYEDRPSTREAIFYASCRTAQTILNEGCKAEIAILPGPEKGIDDWVAGQKDPNKNVTRLVDDALALQDYRWAFFNSCRGFKKYTPDIKGVAQKLTDLVPVEDLPKSGLVAIRSDLGTGKTYLLEKWRELYPSERFLNNGHRVNLLKNLATRLNTQMYSAVNGYDLSDIQALSITVDSLYKMANNLRAYDCLFIDESCQYLAHLLKSKTCREHRSEIVEVLEYLVYNSRLVILADAHLDDLTIDFFRSLRPAGEKPFVIQNDYKQGGRNVHWYDGNNTSQIVASILLAVQMGKKIAVCSDSKRTIKKLETALLGDLPASENPLKIWSLTSENSGSEENVEAIKDINQAVKSCDVFLFSPTLGTGVDICQPHFDEVFGIFHDVNQTATECAQQLWRYRPKVPMHVWVAPRPPFGYQECNPRKIKDRTLQKNELTAVLLRIDRVTGRRGIEKEWLFDAHCQIEAQRNRSINNLRQDLRTLLEHMGNIIIREGDGSDEIAKEIMKLAGERIDEAHCFAVSNAADIDQKVYDFRRQQDYLSPEELMECEKYRLKETYGVEVTPELVEKDDGGRFIKRIVALEAILSEPGEVFADEFGREYPTPPSVVLESDLKDRDFYPLSLDWRNQSIDWLIRYRLGLKDIVERLMEGLEYSGDEPQLQALAELAHKFSTSIKAFLGRTIAPDASPNKILGELLEQLGLATQSRRPQVDGQRLRYYSLKQEEVDFALQVIEHRRLKREERERKRQEEQKKQEEYAAAMQSRWGHQSPSTPPHIDISNSGGVDGVSLGQPDLKNSRDSLKEAFSFGVDAVISVLRRLDFAERWETVLSLADEVPDKINRLFELIPDWQTI